MYSENKVLHNVPLDNVYGAINIISPPPDTFAKNEMFFLQIMIYTRTIIIASPSF